MARGEAPAAAMVRITGENICDDSYLKGYNTFLRSATANDSGAAIVSAVCGVVEVTDRVVSVRSLSARYSAEVGDVVVGRITDVLPGRWLVDVGAYQHATMPLSNVTEPGGMLRRRGREDELTMRRLFSEGDVLVAEVQRVSPDGFVTLHTRSATKYGRIDADGTFVTVPAGLVRRAKQHFVIFPSGATAIIGVNGRVWVQRTTKQSYDAMCGPVNPTAGAVVEVDSDEHNVIEEDEVQARLAVARVANCVVVLGRQGVAVDATTIDAACKMTLARHMKVHDILQPQNAALIGTVRRFARD